ncbi:MAG: hypothetical protein NUV77_22465, partial [Thermoguttaceae bacterium]|nr:hypothetical protein [Thermoguttaceae bacterium]
MIQQLELRDGRVNGQEGMAGNVLVYVNPGDAERKYLVETLKIDEHTLNSALDPDELARLEFEPSHVAVILKRPDSVADESGAEFRVTSVGAFLFETRLVIVQGDSAFH